MYPQKQNANRGYLGRELKRKKARKLAASQWQKETFPQKEGKMNASFFQNRNTRWIPAILLVIVLCIGLTVAAFIWNPFGFQVTRSLTTPPPAAVEEPESLLPTPVVEPTEIPVVPTEIPVIEPTLIPAQIAVVCTTPSIKASLDGQTWTEQGEFLDTVLGKRMTFTNRKVVVPSKAWNDPLTPDELKLVEQTWVKIQICVVEGQNATLFAGGYEQGLNRFENGILLSLKPGLYEFNLRNGEAVIWYPGQETFSQKDLERIFDQIRVGNFDIKGELAFFGVTTDLLPKIPQDLVELRNVQIVPSVDPSFK